MSAGPSRETRPRPPRVDSHADAAAIRERAIRPRRAVASGMKIAALAILVVSVAGPGISPGTVSPLLKLLGASLMAGLILCEPLRRGVPLEALLYFAFVFWGGATAGVAADPALALGTAWKMLQVGIVFWAVMMAHRRHPDLRLTMAGLWMGGLGWALIVWLNPEASATLEGGRRLSVLGENPNTGGQVFVFAIFGSVYLLQRTRGALRRLALFASLPFFSVLLLLTGSRKMLVATVVLGASWLVMGAREGVTRHGHRFVYFILLLAVAGMALGTAWRWRGSPMALRWSNAVQGLGGEGAFAGRGALYKDGWELFLENPIAGVGLMNQAVIAGYAFHSDFIDVLASTGIVGGLLYFSVYAVAFRKAKRVRRVCGLKLELEWRAFVVYLAVLLWLMSGFQRYDDLFNIVVLGSFVGFFLGTREQRTSTRVVASPLGEGHPARAHQLLIASPKPVPIGPV